MIHELHMRESHDVMITNPRDLDPKSRLVKLAVVLRTMSGHLEDADREWRAHPDTFRGSNGTREVEEDDSDFNLWNHPSEIVLVLLVLGLMICWAVSPLLDKPPRPGPLDRSRVREGPAILAPTMAIEHLPRACSEQCTICWLPLVGPDRDDGATATAEMSLAQDAEGGLGGIGALSQCTNPDLPHLFHEECLSAWIAVSIASPARGVPSCPVCKQPFCTAPQTANWTDADVERAAETASAGVNLVETTRLASTSR